MIASVDTNSDVPIYEQIYNSILTDILTGKLAPNEAIPSIRTVASELGISVISAKKAWEMLDEGGFIYTVVGSGSFVKELGIEKIEEIKIALAQSKLEKQIPFLRSVGINRKTLIEIIEKIY